jgi:hypothetical protein
VIHWSFLHRRELSVDEVKNSRWQLHYQNIKSPQWPDCRFNEINKLPDHIREEILSNHDEVNLQVSDQDLRKTDKDPAISDQENINHTINFIRNLELAKKDTTIIHSVVPTFGSTVDNQELLTQFENLSINFIPEFSTLDYARDGTHYDIKTSEYFVNKIIRFIIPK